MSLLKNKRALIVGLASNRSIAYGIAEAFKLPEPRSANKEVVMEAVSLPSGDYAIVRLLNINRILSVKPSAEERDVFRSELAHGFGLLDYQLTIDSQISQAKIDRDPS